MAVTDYLRGIGTQSDPYVIHSYAAMVQWLLVDCRSGKYGVLVSDIDLNGYDVVGNYIWNGNLDGNGFAIKKLRALTGWITLTGVIKRTVIDSWTPYSTGSSASGLLYVNGGTMSNNIFTGSTIGSVISFYGSGSITNCISNGSASLNGDSYASSVYILPGSPSSPAGATDLRSVETPYASNRYPALTALPDTWVVDGATAPRLIKQPTSKLTQSWAVKGVTKVGGIPKQRRCSIHSNIDLNLYSSVLSNQSSGEYVLYCGTYSDHVYVTHRDDYGSKFYPSKLYSGGEIIHPSTPNGYRYICTTAGTSAATEPTNWPTSGTLVSGSAIFTALPVYKPELFVVAPMLIDMITGQPV